MARIKKERPRKWRGVWNPTGHQWVCGACGTPLPPHCDSIKHMDHEGQIYWLAWYHCTACIHQSAICARADLSAGDPDLTASVPIPAILPARVTF